MASSSPPRIVSKAIPFSRSNSRSAAIMSAFISTPCRRTPPDHRPRRGDVVVGDAQLSAVGGDGERLRVGRDQRAPMYLRSADRLDGFPLHTLPEACRGGGA